MEATRRLAQNPGLGAFRVHAAMRQMGFDLSRATCGRLLARVREVYGYEKPQGGGGARRAMPFAASERHEVWSADVGHLDMVDEGLVGGKAYAVAVMDNYSRAILASAVTRRQDLLAFLSVLYWAVERHGAPGTLVTDSGSVFLSNRAKAVYVKVGVSKEEIEKGRPWQNYSETTFGIQRRMADWHFARAESWAELAEAHDRFVLDYNAQEPLRPPAARGRVAEGSQAGGLCTQKLTPAGDASAGSLHLHGRLLAATQRRILFHRCESYTSQSL